MFFSFPDTSVMSLCGQPLEMGWLTCVKEAKVSVKIMETKGTI